MQYHDLNELEELTEEHLGFSALSPGLGFSKPAKPLQSTAHPLVPTKEVEAPTPPHPANPTKNPSGASAAGPAMPVMNPPRVVVRKSTSVATPVAPSKELDLISEPAASIYLRLSAFVLDLTLATTPWVLSLLYLVPAGSRLALLRTERSSALLLGAVYLFVYFLLSEGLGGQSPGKMLFDLRVVEDDKYQKPVGFRAALARLVLFAIGLACVGIGPIYSILDSKRRSLHDKVAGTIVRRA